MVHPGPSTGPPPLFAHVAGRWHPTASHDGAQRGVPRAMLAALAGHAAEQAADALGLAPVRFGWEFLAAARPVPIEARIAARPAAPGGAAQEISLEQDGAPVLRASVLLLPRAIEPAGPRSASAGRFGPPADAAPISAAERTLSPCFEGISTRIATGGLLRDGPATAWLRLERPLVAGWPATAFVRAVQAAALAARIGGTGAKAVDCDLHLWRAPAGQWMLVDARTEAGSARAGTALATLHDLEGAFGVVAATLERPVDG